MAAIAENVFILPQNANIMLAMKSSRVVKPLIGISCCTKQFGIFGMPNHAASNTYVEATDQIVGGVPVLIPANGPTADVETLLERLDGIILTGSRSNVHPSYYDGPPHAEGTWEDLARDGTTLPLIRGAVAAWRAGAGDLPRLPGTERGAGRLPAPAVAGPAGPDRPFLADGRHRARCSIGKAHSIRITPGGWLHRLAGATEIAVNSLHNQGVDKLAPGWSEWKAWRRTGRSRRCTCWPRRPDRCPVSPSACSGTRRYDWRTDSVSRRIFEDFAAAVHAYVADGGMGGVSPPPTDVAFRITSTSPCHSG